MLSGFTETARQAVVIGQDEAFGLRDGSIRPEHLRLGVLRSGGAGSLALQRLGLREGAARAATGARHPPERDSASGQMPFAPDAKAALEAAGELGGDTGALLRALFAAPASRAVLDGCVDVSRFDEVVRSVAGLADEAGRPSVLDPSDPGPPIPVRLGGERLGDLGHPRVDARPLLAIVLRGGRVAERLAIAGVDEAEVRRGFVDHELGFE